LTALAFEAAYWLRIYLPLEKEFALSPAIKFLLFGVASFATVFFALWVQLYERLDSAYPWAVLREAIKQTAFTGICLILFEFGLRLDLSRGFLLLFLVAQCTFILLFRWNAGALVGMIRREFGGPYYVLIFGRGAEAERLAQEFNGSSKMEIRLLGILDDPAALREKIRQQVVDEVLFAVPPSRLQEIEELLLQCDEEGIRTRLSLDFFPHVNSELYLDRFGDTPLLTFSATPHDEVKLLAKRAVDFTVALTGLIILSPLLLLTAILVKLTSPGPILFRQQRCGLNGRRFDVLKFRSMVKDAEQRRSEVEHLNIKKLTFKVPKDPRLTPLGRWLRKFSIDELPQLWNVLRGDMSLVGPRPAIPSEVEQYEPWQRRRLRMRPGLTCIWAISGRDELDTETVMRLDMQYIDNWSLGLDSRILLRTIPLVLLGRGAH
jgi:exopolysaccharide biosynthesis polyprenyl glycosylphosphotransferase